MIEPSNPDLESDLTPTFVVSEGETESMSNSESEAEIGRESEFSASVTTKASETQLQIQKATLLHIQTNTTIELPQHLPVIHIGKTGGSIPPDIDISGLPDSQFVSRVHADIRVEADAFYIEDVGSSNGTYINHIPLAPGNRHRLRSGERIALGKEDKVSFIFQLN
jgi:pSer/pThr/pTyr-binding forkhead associated (FHA) protein